MFVKVERERESEREGVRVQYVGNLSVLWRECERKERVCVSV